MRSWWGRTSRKINMISGQRIARSDRATSYAVLTSLLCDPFPADHWSLALLKIIGQKNSSVGAKYINYNSNLPFIELNFRSIWSLTHCKVHVSSLQQACFGQFGILEENFRHVFWTAVFFTSHRLPFSSSLKDVYNTYFIKSASTLFTLIVSNLSTYHDAPRGS